MEWARFSKKKKKWSGQKNTRDMSTTFNLHNKL